MNILRTLLTTVLVFSGWVAMAAVPDELEGGVSPNKRYDVVLDTTPEVPTLMVRELPSRKLVGQVPWPGDVTGGDAQPLRNHATVLWQPKGEVVVIHTQERYYAHTTVLALVPKTGAFVDVPFPDYKTLTGFPTPKSDDLRPRGFAQVMEWTPEGYLVYVIQYAAEASYKGPDPLKHRITLAVAPLGMKVIRREAVNE